MELEERERRLSLKREQGKRWREKYQERNKALRREWSKGYRERHRAEIRLKDRIKRAENPEAEKEKRRLKQIRDRDAGRRKIVRANRRARLRGAGKLSASIYPWLLEKQKGLCVYCRLPLAGSKAHLDHVVPLALGGPNVDSNMQLLCPPCNQRKGAKHPVSFAAELGMLL